MRSRWVGPVLFVLVAACASAPPAPPGAPPASPTLMSAADGGMLALSDALEAEFDRGTPPARDLDWAHDRVAEAAPTSAAEAYGKAKILARWIQARGLTAANRLREVEALLRQSRTLDPAFRRGAAQRMLGVLYVNAPPKLVEHGDSEEGLSLLEDLVEKYPDDVENQLRLAEGYQALNDPDPAVPLLCTCERRRAELRPSDQRRLDELLGEAGELSCP